MSSTEIYLPYYSPTDVPNQNKVKYTVDVGSDTSLIITSNNGFVNLNRINVYDQNYTNDETTSLRTGINDYLYTVMKTQGYKFGQVNLQNSGLPAYVGGKRELNNTITKQLSIDNFDYNYIYGLPTAKQQVIDWNYFVNMENVGAKNIFGQTSNIADTSIRLNNKVTNVKLGPRLFYYNSNTEQNVGYRGAGFQTNIGTNSTVKNIVDNGLTGISNYYGLTINDVTINSDTKIQTLEQNWPYKVQPASDQYYQMITNGIQTGLLTIPHEPTDNQTSYYMLSIGNNGSDQVIQYSKLDDIVENNYYYITSYFDARPTIQTNTNLYFPSTCASLFNENLVQVLPLMPFYTTMPNLLHNGNGSNIANVNPVCYTTFNQGSIYNMSNWTSQPTTVIPLKWDKNITITTQLNFTCANLTNLSNILTGWNYLRKDFSNSSDIISRANLPYVNVGVMLYFPSQNDDFDFVKNDNTENTNNKYIRFINWLKSFTTNGLPFYESIVDNSVNYEAVNNDILNQIYNYTYNNIETETTSTNKVKYATFSNASNVACINFNRSNAGDPYDDKLGLFNNDINNNLTNFISNVVNINQFVPPYSANNENYQESLQNAQTDIIKFYTTLSVPITNALNTTYSMNDTCTFCFTKNGAIKTAADGTNDYVGTTYLADRYYIIGTFMYITRSLPTTDIKNNPHYIGFAPSTNIASMDLLSDNGAGGVNQLYNYPASISSSFVTDTSNPLSNSYVRGSNPMKNPIMKDMFATPSLFMTINESVNNI